MTTEHTFPATHVVADGDSLSKLAEHYYGDGTEKGWRHIYEANREAIGDDPDLITTGVALTIPAPPA